VYGFSIFPKPFNSKLGRKVHIDVLWEEMDWEAETSGPVPTRVLDSIRDDQSLVERFLTDLESKHFPHLSFISRETVTIFHQQHIPQLVQELEALSERKHEPQVATHLGAVLQFVTAACGPEDTLISFQVREWKEGNAA
jgi:hypothetical protein